MPLGRRRRPSPPRPSVLRRWRCCPNRLPPPRRDRDRPGPGGPRPSDRAARPTAGAPPAHESRGGAPRQGGPGPPPGRGGPRGPYPGPNAGRPPRLDRGPADRQPESPPAPPIRPAAAAFQRRARGQRPAPNLRPAQATLGSPHRRTRKFALRAWTRRKRPQSRQPPLLRPSPQVQPPRSPRPRTYRARS